MSLITRRSSVCQPTLASFPLLTMFNDLLSEPAFSASAGPRSDTTVNPGTLPVDVSEDETSLIVRASLPGFRKEEVDIQVHEGVLSIRGQRTEETTQTAERYHRRERRTGIVSRLLSLPETVNGDDVKAELRDGVLTLRLPKIPKEQPRKVQIS